MRQGVASKEGAVCDSSSPESITEPDERLEAQKQYGQDRQVNGVHVDCLEHDD